MLGSLVFFRILQALRFPLPLREGIPLLLLFAVSPAIAQVSTEQTIQMSDGVLLEATITLPAGTIPPAGFPGVVFIHGYGGNKADYATVASYLASQGYAALLYSVRGQGNSGGLSTTMGERERQDLQEVLKFFRKFPGIDPDKLGVAGGSQGGIHAWMAATYSMPGVAAVAALLASPSFALDLVPANCLKQQLHAELTLSSVRYDSQKDRMRDFCIAERYDSVLALVSPRDLERRLDSVRIPVMQIGGWADALFPVNGSLRAVQRLSQRGIPVRSYFGTNGHGEPVQINEALFMLGFLTIWFDHWLRGVPLDRAIEPVVVYADDRPGWPHRETTGWPPEPKGTTRLYFSGTSLRTSLPATTFESPFRVDYDPAYTGTRGWADGYGGPAFRAAFRSTAARFLSSPLLDTMDVTGVPRGHIQLKSNGPRFQSHLRLFDVAPADTGFTWTVIAHGTNGVRDYLPGTLIVRDIECNALSHHVPPGHRIGVEVTSLDMYDSSRAQIIPYFTSTASVVSGSSVAPSYIDLPLVGGGTFASAEPVAAAPASFVLYQNYPNPFNPTTTVRFTLASAGMVRLEVFTVTGQRVALLLDGFCERGEYALLFDGSRYATGLYLCRLTAGRHVAETKMLLVK